MTLEMSRRWSHVSLKDKAKGGCATTTREAQLATTMALELLQLAK